MVVDIEDPLHHLKIYIYIYIQSIPCAFFTGRSLERGKSTQGLDLPE